MKISQVELKDVEFFIDEDGEAKSFSKNEKKYPCFVTNHSLDQGKNQGLTKSSLIADLFKLQGIESKNKDERNDAYQGLDQTEMQKVIYLGFIGANKGEKLSFNEFLEKFHYNFEETIELYMDLVTNLISGDKNNFAKGLKDSTKKKANKK